MGPSFSSPSDVLIERDRAEAVVKRVNARRIDRPQFELIRWELDYYGAKTDFQLQIPKPSECQLVIGIFGNGSAAICRTSTPGRTEHCRPAPNTSSKRR